MTITVNPLFSYASSGSQLGYPLGSYSEPLVTGISPSSNNSMIFAVIGLGTVAGTSITSATYIDQASVMFGNRGMDRVVRNSFYVPDSHGIHTEIYCVRNDSTDPQTFEALLKKENRALVYLSIFEVIPTSGNYIHYTDYVRSTLSGSATVYGSDTSITITPPVQSAGDVIISALSTYYKTSAVAASDVAIHSNLYYSLNGANERRMATAYKVSTGNSSISFSVTGTNNTGRYQATTIVIKESPTQLRLIRPYSIDLLRSFNSLTTNTSFSGSITLTNANSIVTAMYSIDGGGTDGVFTCSADISGSPMNQDALHIYTHVSPSFYMRTLMFSVSGSHATGDFTFSGSIVGANGLVKSRVLVYEIIPPRGFKYTQNYTSGSWGGGFYNPAGLPLTTGSFPNSTKDDFIIGMRGVNRTDQYYKVTNHAERIAEYINSGFTIMPFCSVVMADGETFQTLSVPTSDSYVAVSYHPEPLPPSGDVIWW